MGASGSVTFGVRHMSKGRAGKPALPLLQLTPPDPALPLPHPRGSLARNLVGWY
jgi:hypothetical protein